jgi:hypothetical protein
MIDKKPRNYIVKEKKSGNYFYGNAGYGNNLSKAHRFEFHKDTGYFRTDPDSEIIFLDEERGLELLVKERQKLSEEIDAKEKELKAMKENIAKLHELNREMIDKYESECFKKYNDASGIRPETKKLIIREIVSKKI